jgi:hypothetical protein
MSVLRAFKENRISFRPSGATLDSAQDAPPPLEFHNKEPIKPRNR